MLIIAALTNTLLTEASTSHTAEKCYARIITTTIDNHLQYCEKLIDKICI